METAVVIIAAIIALGVVFVVLPVFSITLGRFKNPFAIRCPETGNLTSVEMDACRAARSALFGRLKLRVKGCALWPARRGCDEKCLEEIREGEDVHTLRRGGWSAPEHRPLS